MPKYLVHGSYTQEGLKGLLKEGGSKRREAVEQAARGLGGSVDDFYFALGKDDFFVILDMPGIVDLSALALAVNAAGTAKTKVTVLITPAEVDQAVEKKVSYRAPGK